MKRRILFCSMLAASALLAAPSPASQGKAAPGERISEKGLLKGDTIQRFTVQKPCHLDKYKYFCCPVRKIVRRRSAEGKWMDYCYNSRDELIGLRSGNHKGYVKRSDFTAVTGCSSCRSTTFKQHSWKHDTRPRLAPPKKKKKR